MPLYSVASSLVERLLVFGLMQQPAALVGLGCYFVVLHSNKGGILRQKWRFYIKFGSKDASSMLEMK
jgi:hypothetical protein